MRLWAPVPVDAVAGGLIFIGNWPELGIEIKVYIEKLMPHKMTLF